MAVVMISGDGEQSRDLKAMSVRRALSAAIKKSHHFELGGTLENLPFRAGKLQRSSALLPCPALQFPRILYPLE